ncbi:MAG: sigma factor [Marmoricola sp.]
MTTTSALDDPEGGSSPGSPDRSATVEDSARPPNPFASLALLLRCSGRGDQDSFAELYDATSGRAYGLAVQVVGDPARAEQVTLDAYVEVWRNSNRFHATHGGVLPWILTIVHREAVAAMRSAAAHVGRHPSYDGQHRPVADAAGPDSHEASQVSGALATLTPVQHAAVELAYFGGRLHTEMDSVLGVPAGTARARIRQGLLQLRAMLTNETAAGSP